MKEDVRQKNVKLTEKHLCWNIFFIEMRLRPGVFLLTFRNSTASWRQLLLIFIF